MRNILQAEAERLRQLILEMGRHHSLRNPVPMDPAALELTAAQAHALMWLGHDGPLTMGELARAVRVNERTATGLVDRMERAGLAQRQRDARDRRVVRVTLSRKGWGAFRKLERHMFTRMTGLLGMMDAADRKTLFQILEKLMQRLRQAG